MKKIKRFIKRIYLIVFDVIIFNLRGFIRILKNDCNVDILRSLENKHLNERCFIVATGPSLRIEDVEKLSNEFTFSVNSIFLIGDKTKWRSTYYLCLDEQHMKKMLDNYGDKIDSVSKDYKFFNANSKKEIEEYRNKGNKLENYAYLNISRVNELRYVNSKKPFFFFRKNPLCGIYNSGTVTNSAIIMAMWMGFKEIYLLGTDCNYSGKIRHVEKDWNEDNMSITEKELIELRMKNGFAEISREAKKMGVKIYNATRGGMLEDFERIDFDTIKFK